MRHYLLAVLVAALLVGGTALTAPVHAADKETGPVVRWVADASDAKRAVVEVSGIPAAALEEWSRSKPDRARWQRLLPVVARQGELIELGLPPMLGEYRVEAGVVRFRPQFPLEPGVEYRARFQPEELPGAALPAAPAAGKSIIADYQLPAAPPAEPTTVVSQIYPSGDVVPENLLKFYVHFSAPMSGGAIYDHIRLRDVKAGKDVELPFLEIDEELWDPRMTRLTLFIDPGRIKRGVQPLEEVGPALEAGKSYTLVIDRAWKDAAGRPMKASYEKAFRAGPPDREPPNPTKWKVEAPKAGTRDALALTFGESLDRALAERLIRVADAAGRPVEGKVAVGEAERGWSFVPAGPWRAGRYDVVVGAMLEDLAGNNPGKPFDLDLQDPGNPTPVEAASPVRLRVDVH
jgi:hypothetical protein